MRQRLSLKQDPEKEVPAEVFEQAIVDIGKAMRAISKTRLTREAIVVLIKDKARIDKHVIELVLNNLERLEEIWLKPCPKRLK